MEKSVILASGSPRRKQLLEMAGVPLVVEVSDADESHAEGVLPQDYARQTAFEKASCVMKKHIGQNVVIVAADTIVVLDGAILGKPRDGQDAVRMLKNLSGRDHQVMTGVCVMDAESGTCVQFLAKTHVYFCPLTDGMIERYVATGEPMDKAGAYGIQAGAAGFVEKIDGSYTNVVGLPVCETMNVLRQFGVPV